jgi:hypothetical protein
MSTDNKTKCVCGNTKDSNGNCDGSHANK